MADRLTFWFRRKYNLAPTDPRFLSMTMHGIETEYWAWHYFEHPASEEVEDDEFDEEAYLAEIEARAEARRAKVAAAPVPASQPVEVVNVTTTLDPLNNPDDWEDIDI